jgi:putative ABC transport system permease protein
MIRNYFKIAWRNLWRNRSFTIINIAGLGVAIAVSIAIFLIIRFEESFDNFHPKKDRIYRVLTEMHSEDGIHLDAGVPFPLPTAMHTDFASMKTAGVYSPHNEQIVVPGINQHEEQKKFREERGVFFAEPSLFEIFSYPLLVGDYASLNEPFTALVTKETAERYFGDWKSAIGRVFMRNGNEQYRVTGVLAPIPSNTDLQIKVVASYASRKNYVTSTDWNSVSSNHGCYVLLPEGMSPASMNEQFKSFVKKYKKGPEARDMHVVQPISEVHYDASAGNFLDRSISKRLITTLWLIAAFILIIACVNFINLSTAQAVNRSREVGVRKVLGSNRRQLAFQFYSETTLITITSTLLAIGLTTLCMPAIRTLLDLPLEFNLAKDPFVIAFLLGITVFVILLAGFYPSIVLSRFNPITALKSKVRMSSTKGLSLRRVLVVVQFVIAQGLIIGTLIIVQQMDYFRSKSMGFDKEAIVNIAFPQDSAGRSKLDYLKDKLAGINGVKSVSFSYASPADNGNWYSNFRFNHAEKDVDWAANLKWADANYLNTYSIPLVAGRNLLPSDTAREYLVNETLVKKLGITNPADALNKEINMWDGQMKGQIVGVIKDFNTLSFREALPPVLLSTMRDFYATAGIKMQTGQAPEIVKQVKSLWNEVYPNYVYEPRFLDAKIESFYTQESRLSNLYKVFAALAIFLSCLGLYGLASFMAVQRVKEVGIRKVLGASIGNIVMLFSKEFILLIVIAFTIAAPLAWYYMNDWLQDFVYRISITWWVLLIAGLLATFIALITISFKAIHAALANPVKNLRTE